MITTNNVTKFCASNKENTQILKFITVKMFLTLSNNLKNKLFTMYRYSKKSW